MIPLKLEINNLYVYTFYVSTNQPLYCLFIFTIELSLYFLTVNIF